MPVGPYSTFAECVAAQKKKGHSDESARKICGKIEKQSGTFRLTPGLVAAHAGSGVVCLASQAMGQTYRLHTNRPSAETNRRLGGVVVSPDGSIQGNDGDEDAEGSGPVTRVEIVGVIEQRAGYHDECGGWSDGHDAIADRLIAALEETDVLLVIDSPGGAHAGMEQAIDRVVREKMEHGRRVTAFVDEMCGSAAYWWAACIADEIYAPVAGIAGSIGARAAHGSEAGALLKAGIEITYFCWPSAGKIAFAPELPLSDIGRQRGERDVAIAGEAFANAVEKYRGLTREQIVELDADALSGQLAVNAGLIDGVASYEDVLSYCIALAEKSDGDPGMTQTKHNRPATHNASPALALRAEGDEDEKKMAEDEPDKKMEGDEPEPKEEEPKGKEPDAICKNCGHQQEEDAKYCDQCGESMEASPMEEEDAGDGEGDPDADPDADDDKKKAEGEKPGEKKMTPPPPMKETKASYAKLLGVRQGASDLSIKTALVRKLQVGDYVATLTGATDEREQLGQLRAMAEDAKESSRLRKSLHTLHLASNAKERLDLLLSLSAAGLPDYPRGNLLVDEVADNGRVLSVKPAPAYAEMKLATLRGLVKGKLANAAPKAARSPFAVANADFEAATSAASVYQIETSKKNPVVVKVVRNGVKEDVAAGIYAREFGGIK